MKSVMNEAIEQLASAIEKEALASASNWEHVDLTVLLGRVHTDALPRLTGAVTNYNERESGNQEVIALRNAVVGACVELVTIAAVTAQRQADRLTS